ncbi:MAG: peptide deformylase [Deltaproteobacteria bacterium]|nr:peptide deformylase [Deltaproteobacteria bacterium]
MSIRKIYKYPDPVLRKKAATVTSFDEKLEEIISDMAQTMYDAPGIGLAAPQIGQSIRLIVVDITEEPDDEKKYMTMINPEISIHTGNQLDEEGCLSVPELTANVKRYKEITVSYQDTKGDSRELSAENRFAVVLQHEIDHLNGVLFLDHLSSLKRGLYKKKVKKWLAEK